MNGLLSSPFSSLEMKAIILNRKFVNVLYYVKYNSLCLSSLSITIFS